MSLKSRSLRQNRKLSHSEAMEKCIEELLELALILVQEKTRRYSGKPIDKQKIIDEVGDVKRYLWFLEDIYGETEIKKRIKSKVKGLEDRTYKGLNLSQVPPSVKIIDACL